MRCSFRSLERIRYPRLHAGKRPFCDASRRESTSHGPCPLERQHLVRARQCPCPHVPGGARARPRAPPRPRRGRLPDRLPEVLQGRGQARPGQRDREDFAAAQGETYKTIEILDFVPYEQIDPIYFERTYYLGPEQGAEKVYALLVRAMEQSELAGVVRYVFHDRERLGCLRVRDGVLVLERMYFADEIRPHDEIRPKRRGKVDDQELELALSLIERITSDFDPGRYEDRYRDRLLKVIREKRKGKTIEAPRSAPSRRISWLRLGRASSGRRAGTAPSEGMARSAVTAISET